MNTEDDDVGPPFHHEDTDDDADWDEIEVPSQPLPLQEHPAPQEEKQFEITLKARPGTGKEKEDAARKRALIQEERSRRITSHKIHTVCLLINARVRNTWMNDELLHARLLSLTPLPLQNSFAMIHKSRIPEQGKRGRMFEAAVARLAEWWSGVFFEVMPEGHVRNRTFTSLQNMLSENGVGPHDEIETERLPDILDADSEPIRSPKSLMKHALIASGSRDTSAQLFTSLCRGLGIPSRLVVSLQSVPWQAAVGKPKTKNTKSKKGKGKVKESALSASEERSDEDDMEEVAIPRSSPSVRGDTNGFFHGVGQRLDEKPVEKSEKARGKEKAKQEVKLRKTRSKGHVLGSASSSTVAALDPLQTPPVFWTEVFSRPDGRWLPIDPIRGIVNNRKVFDPSGLGDRAENRMVYVVAFEEDGYARDVTRRYAKDFGAKVAKVQGGSNGNVGSSGGEKGRLAWWERVMYMVTRPYRLHRDDIEDAELDSNQIMEGMPTSIAGFKDHPLYVLERHLKQNEIIYPPPPDTPELGKFRGEPVYPRSNIVNLKTAENWLRSEGRSIKEGEQPMKLAKVRPGTVNRMRELEIMKDGLREAGEAAATGDVMQGLYARSQTERFVPVPVIDGKVPKNDFGNIDLYVPSMLPAGAVHVPFKGVAKIAKRLGIDYAEAVTGFEFKKRRAFPVVDGVVVAAENEKLLIEAYLEAEQNAEEKARAKREERVLKRWTRLIHGLRIRQRLQEQYADREEPASSKSGLPENSDEVPGQPERGGGFLIEADDVVQPFHLPKAQWHDSYDTPSKNKRIRSLTPDESPPPSSDPATVPFDLEVVNIEGHMSESEGVLGPAASKPMPMSMHEMAEAAAQLRKQINESLEPERNFESPLSMPGTDLGEVTSSGNRGATTLASKKLTGATRRQLSTENKVGSKRRRKKGSDEEDGPKLGDEERSSPSKRVKRSVVVPAPTRTLRPRAAKSQAQLRRELEEEELDQALEE